MSKTFEQGREEVARLCEYFETNRQPFLAFGVKETHVRQSLIDPLFEELGWDVSTRNRTAPQNREIIPEDSLDVEGQQRAPDYTFRVGTLPKFYAEAKKCGVNIASDIAPAYQVRRYGWSANFQFRTMLKNCPASISSLQYPSPSKKYWRVPSSGSHRPRQSLYEENSCPQ